MNRLWKWTIGILGILIVLAILAIPFALHNRLGFRATRGFDRWHGPMIRDHHEFGLDRFHAPMMHSRGFGHWGGIFFLFGGLLYGAYWLGRRNARVVLDPTTSPPATLPMDESEARPKDT
jgi:hypothetical protein